MEEKRENRISRLEKCKRKKEELKRKLINRAIENLIEMVVQEESWRIEVEEEINKNREMEIIRESGKNIMRKRRASRKLKYRFPIEEEKIKLCGEGGKREWKIPRRRKEKEIEKEGGKEYKGGKPQIYKNKWGEP